MRLPFKRDKKLKRESDFLEAEEILFNKEAVSRLKEEEELGRLEVPIGQWGLNAIFVCGVFILIFSLGLVAYLNFVKGKEYQQAAERNVLKSVPIIADRGLIFDNQNKTLVYNQEVFDLVFFPAYLPIDKAEREKVLKKIEDRPEIAAAINKENLEEDNPL
ncbi:MAG TPA: hypothetical protein PLB19_01835, partial [Candidatus Paceibacterota bacterium]|nr:hypothetical protein [Candidatus Paceibacterota bacterium]